MKERDKWNDTTKKQVDNIQKMEPFIKKLIIFSKSWYDKGQTIGGTILDERKLNRHSNQMPRSNLDWVLTQSQVQMTL